MAAANVSPNRIEAFPITAGAIPNVTAPSSPTIRFLGLNSTIASVDLGVKAPLLLSALFLISIHPPARCYRSQRNIPPPRHPEDQRHAQDHLRPEVHH